MKIELKDIEKVLKENDNFYILTHKSPDGDTLGSAFALCFALQKMNKNAKVLCSDVIPEKYKFLYENLEIQNFNPKYIISVDVAEAQLLGDILNCYANQIDLSIDHHMLNQKFAKLWYIDSTAAATAEIIYEIIRKLEVRLDFNIAKCIYTGVSTDTGCFKNANTSARSHRIAAKMIDLGVDNFKIDKIMFDTKSKTKLNYMVKKFSVPCSFDSGNVAPFDFFIGDPNNGKHPIEFQSKWLTEVKGGHVPQEIMDSIKKIKDLADRNNVSFEDLCIYAINIANDKAEKEIPEFNNLLVQLNNS